jgi:brassinosteroid-6-oxidase 1
MAFYITFKQIVGADQADRLYEPFKEAFDMVATGTLSLPINIPGTNYHMGLQVYI